MKVWKDITSIHSVGRCLDGQPTSVEDVNDFLQFCTELIYSDQNSVTTHGPNYMALHTQGVCQTIVNEISESNFISVYEYPDKDIIIKRGGLASDRLIEHFQSNFPILNPEAFSQVDGNHFPTAYIEKLKPTIEIIKAVLIRGEDNSSYRNEILTSLDDDEFNFSLFVLLNDYDLIELLRTSFSASCWSDSNICSLIASCRVLINQVMSHSEKYLYAPSYIRAIHNQNLLQVKYDNVRKQYEHFNNTVDKNLSGFPKADLDIPSAIKYFLLSGESVSFQSILEKALKARSELSWVREEILSDLNDVIFSEDCPDAYVKLNKKLSYCANDIVNVYKKQGSKYGALENISNAMTMNSSAADESTGISIKGAILKEGGDFIRQMKFNKNQTILTHILNSKTSGTSDEIQRRIGRLYRESINRQKSRKLFV